LDERTSLRKLGIERYTNEFLGNDVALDQLAGFSNRDQWRQVFTELSIAEEHRSLVFDWLLAVASGATVAAKAVYTWPSPDEEAADGDLIFKVGTSVEVLSEEPGSGWMTGVISGDHGGVAGIFPSNYVELAGPFPTRLPRIGGHGGGGTLEAAPVRHTGYLEVSGPGLRGNLFCALGDGLLSFYKAMDARSRFIELCVQPSSTVRHPIDPTSNTLLCCRDLDDSGTLDQNEIRRLCGLLGKKVGKRDMAKHISQIDTDANGEVTFEEFAKFWSAYGGKNARPDAQLQVSECRHIALHRDGQNLEFQTDAGAYVLKAETAADAEIWLSQLTASL
jgi:hypothetical protein